MWSWELANKINRQLLTHSLKEMLLLMALIKFELDFATIMGIQKHINMRLDRETPLAIFYCRLAVQVTWPLLWLETVFVAWPFTENNVASLRYIIYKYIIIYLHYPNRERSFWLFQSRFKSRLFGSDVFIAF